MDNPNSAPQADDGEALLPRPRLPFTAILGAARHVRGRLGDAPTAGLLEYAQACYARVSSLERTTQALGGLVNHSLLLPDCIGGQQLVTSVAPSDQLATDESRLATLCLPLAGPVFVPLSIIGRLDVTTDCSREAARSSVEREANLFRRTLLLSGYTIACRQDPATVLDVALTSLIRVIRTYAANRYGTNHEREEEAFIQAETIDTMVLAAFVAAMNAWLYKNVFSHASDQVELLLRSVRGEAEALTPGCMPQSDLQMIIETASGLLETEPDKTLRATVLRQVASNSWEG
jgi:hypothetical protein